MLQEFSGGEDVPERRPGGAPAGKYDQLWQLSMADPHTGLANKLLLLDRLTQALARRRRHGGEVAVCHIDLDNLGEINLDLGYTTGNTVLCEGARRLTAILRAEDTVGRVGGSELVVVVAVDDEQDAGPLVRRLQQTLEEPVVVGGQSIRMHARLGLALAEADETAEDVLSPGRPLHPRHLPLSAPAGARRRRRASVCPDRRGFPPGHSCLARSGVAPGRRRRQEDRL